MKNFLIATACAMASSVAVAWITLHAAGDIGAAALQQQIAALERRAQSAEAYIEIANLQASMAIMRTRHSGTTPRIYSPGTPLWR